jgi:hypothetical protein
VVTTPSTPVRRLGKGLVTVLATGLLLTACGSDSGGGKNPPAPPTAPSVRSTDEVKAATIESWDACEMFADHVREFAEFLEYKEFTDELFSSNGSNSAGVRLCSGDAVYLEDPEYASGNLQGRIEIGFGRAGMEDSLQDEEYRTPTGRYDLMLQLMRDLYEADNLAERTEDGPWEEATVLLGDTSTGTTLSGFILDTKRDFMLKLSVGGLDLEPHGDKVTWTLEEAAKHFREVTMVNAYQAMADRYDEAS